MTDTEKPEASVEQLSKFLAARLEDGHGEALFDIGTEDNVAGDSMGFTKEQWDFALNRVSEAADKSGAAVKVLMSRNVGGEEDVGPIKENDLSCSGKVLVRRKPASIDDVIETRIAVVGNGMPMKPVLRYNAVLTYRSRCR